MIHDPVRRRQLSIRRRIAGTPERPRLCVKRSNRHIYAQLIDDSQHRVLTGVSSLVAELRDKKLKRTEMGREVGKLIAEKAKALGIKKVVFDRAGRKFHGRIKAVAEGAREGGLEF
ncbi:MAG: 50S ribosomal protein L18 [candidate division WOR-3 bacterium]